MLSSQGSSLWTIPWQARHRHCLQSAGIYDARPGGPGLGGGGDRMAELQCGRDSGGRLVQPPSRSQVPVQRAQQVAAQALPEPSGAAGLAASRSSPFYLPTALAVRNRFFTVCAICLSVMSTAIRPTSVLRSPSVLADDLLGTTGL